VPERVTEPQDIEPAEQREQRGLSQPLEVRSPHGDSKAPAVEGIQE
jgi:hypothetical protein